MNKLRRGPHLSRRGFLERAGGITGLTLAGAGIVPFGTLNAMEQIPSSSRVKQGTQLGSLYPFLRDLQQESQFKLSFLQNDFKEVDSWKHAVREILWRMIPEKPDPCDFKPEVIERVDKGDYFREKVYFHSTPVTRVPAYVLIPKKASRPMPGLVCFHDHGGMYYWGKEKIVELENEHPALRAFKQEAYGGISYATEYCKAGFAVIVIDAFYWGERRLVNDKDVEQGINDWSKQESAEVIQQINQQCGRNEDMMARAIGQIGHTWQGIWLRDEIRSLDYLLTRPEVDPKRIGCVGLSIGGFRSAQFAGMDPRVQCAVVDGWMTSYGEMFTYRPLNTHYLQYITGAYALLDLPDLVSLCCPGALMVIHGRKDVLFTPRGVAEAYQKIEAVYRKAGVPSHADLRYYDTPHEFNLEMQRDALAWLKKWLEVG
jgi:dienelactone hydrolase